MKIVVIGLNIISLVVFLSVYLFGINIVSIVGGVDGPTDITMSLVTMILPLTFFVTLVFNLYGLFTLKRV